MKLLHPKHLLALLLGLSALSAASVAPAQTAAGSQETTAAAELPGARQIIDRYLEVTGLKKAHESRKSLRVRGKIEIVGMGINGTMDVLAARPNLLLINANIEGFGESKSGFDGKVGWRIDAMMGESIVEGIALEHLRRRSADFDNEFHNPKKYEKIETVAKVTFEKKECYKVRFLETSYGDAVDMTDEETKEYREFFEYYDVETGLKAGSENMTESQMGPMAVTAVVVEYKKLGDVLMPVKSLEKLGPQSIQVTIDSVEVNVAKEGDFALPEVIKLLVEDDKPAVGKTDDGK